MTAFVSRIGAVREFRLHLLVGAWIGACLMGPAPALAQRTDPGVTLRVYEVEGNPEKIPTLTPYQSPNHDWLRDRVDFEGDAFGPSPAPILTHVLGEILVKKKGPHTFRLTSDDGSRLTIGGTLIIDNDGRHAAKAVVSEPIELDRGAHPFLIEHFDHVGARILRLEWREPGSDSFSVITIKNLRTERDLTRVTSPGIKRIQTDETPGDGAPVSGVHPAWNLATIRPPGYEPKVGAMAFLPDGRLVIGTFDPLQRDDRTLPDIESKVPDSLFAIGNLDADDPSDVTIERIAGDLYEPTGLCVVDGVLYVANRRAVERLLDIDSDGFFETHEVVGQGWEAWNYHQFAFGLIHRDGKLYTALSTAMAPPAWEGMKENAGPNGPMRGGLVEIDIESGDTRVIAGGMRTPNGLGFTADGAMIYLDNQGTWMPANQLSEVIPGRFYGHYNWTNFVPKLAERFPKGGHPSVLSDRPRTPAAVFLPHGEVCNSPTQPLVIESGPYAGQLLVGELTAGGIRRVMLERVNGQLQGVLFRFTQGLESGVNRMAWGPDGSLYVGGIGAGGNWNWEGTQFGLQRLVPNGTTVFEMREVHAISEGFEIRFTKPVDADWLRDPSHFEIKSWTYEPTASYGGPKVDERTHAVPSAVVSSGSDSVRIRVSDLVPGRCYHIRTDPTSEDGDAIWSTEAWYTLNAIPRESPTQGSSIGGRTIRPDAVGVGVLPLDGAVALTGRNSAAAMRYDGKDFPPEPVTQDQFINGPDSLAVGQGSGDLVSTTSFGDARLHVEWLSPPGGGGQLAGNSGVYLQDRYEIQVLNTPPGNDPPATNEAGAIYSVKSADVNASNGAGAWQAYDIWFRAPRFRDGKKIEDARITLYWNGVLAHDDVAVSSPTGASRQGGEQPADGQDIQIGPLRLQDHASAADGPVRYRNVWIEPLAPESYEPGEWTDLFTDTPESDWMVRGGVATFEKQDSQLVGTTAPNTPNSFYSSRSAYADFELIYEAKIDPRLNSGVQIKSHVIGGADNRDGGLRGYQIEIDPSDRAFSAGIYDEQRRGWLHPLHTAPYARRAFRQGEWNRFRVVATGPIIRTWINGVPAAEIFDATTHEGHLGFQVHGVGDLAEPLEVRFRNARIRPLTKQEQSASSPSRSGNPIVEGWYADPEGAVFGSRYWVFPTYSAPYDDQLHFDAFSSPDLVSWTKHERVLTSESVAWARRAMWAPSVIEKAGRYYFFFAANDIQSDDEVGGIGVAVADRPDGPYHDLLGRPLIDSFHHGAQPIDQFVFRDADGTDYLIYGGWGRCNIARLADDYRSLAPFDDGETFKEITPEGYVEGPFMFTRGGRYYFMWSEGGWTGPDYRVAYAVADSVMGPWKRIGVVLEQDPRVATGAGHHSVIRGPGEDEWYIVYHRRPLGETDRNHRVVCIDRMEFGPDGSILPVTITHEGVPPSVFE